MKRPLAAISFLMTGCESNRSYLAMSNQHQEYLLRRMTDWYLERGRQLYPNHSIRPVKVAFDLLGGTAGYYHPAQLLIRYNLPLAQNQFDAYVNRTVPHEVAHHIVDEVHRTWRRRASPHGEEWRSVMRHFGQDPVRCHDFDLKGIKLKQQRRFSYWCACQEHLITTVRHNRVNKGARYRCIKCNQLLVYKIQEQVEGCKAPV